MNNKNTSNREKKSKSLIENQIDSIRNQPLVLNPFIELVLSDADNNPIRNSNHANKGEEEKEEDYFIYYELNNNEKMNKIRNNDLLLKFDINRKTNYDNRPYCKKHFNLLFNQSEMKNKNEEVEEKEETNCDCNSNPSISLFDKENQSKKLIKLKLKLIEFCSWMNEVFSYEEAEFDTVTLMKIFLVNYENTMSVPIKIEPIVPTTTAATSSTNGNNKLKKDFLKLNNSNELISKNNKIFIKSNSSKNTIKQKLNKWYMPKKYWFTK